MGSKFEWSKVDPTVTRALLVERSQRKVTDRQLKQMTPAALAELAARKLGSPISADVVGQHSRMLLTTWLDVASAATLREFAENSQLGVRAASQRERFRTAEQSRAFLRERYHTESFLKLLRKQFIKAHRVDDGVPKKPPVRRGIPTPVLMEGTGAPAPHPLFAHQIATHEALDELRSRAQEPMACVVVLPTGSGKTETAVTWLLDRLADEPGSRVLWIAGQQELLQQAAARFEKWAGQRPEGFARQGRLIHSGGYPISVLADDDLDIAFVTTKTLAQDVGSERRVVDRFMKRPTFVVFDEAHHAGALTHSAMLDHLRRKKARALIGLTATPFPTSLVGHHRFRGHFPELIQRVTSRELMANGILARPVLHTVETRFSVELTAQERDRAETGDLPPEVLDRLDDPMRNELIVEQYVAQRERWGRTLIFATNISNADDLHQRLIAEGVAAGVMHSRMTEPRDAVLADFDEGHLDVIVSVGMLTEGVDLPSARTAFLARPTASRILLQQMIGRVLRGPTAGGDDIAHLVHFKDQWSNFADVLEPPEVISWPFPGDRAGAPRGEADVAEDDDWDFFLEDYPELEPAGVGDIKRQIALSATVSSARLIGYYELDDRQVPVFEHQEEGWDQLVADALDDLIGKRARMSYFDDTPDPLPVERSVKAVLRYIDENGEAPPFETVVARGGPIDAADAVLAAGPLDDSARVELLQAIHQRGIDRLVYPSFNHFEEAVWRELRERRSPRAHARLDEPIRQPDRQPKKTLPRADRNLRPIRSYALQQCDELLPSELLALLDRDVAVEWTRRPTRSYFAQWTFKSHGKDVGTEKIKVNSVLRTSPEIVSDEMLGYLVFHELLHHLLPWNGHDAEFRRLEALWPDAVGLDAQFDTLGDRWDLAPESYRVD